MPGVPVDRRLTGDEQDLLLYLACRTVAEQTGCGLRDAATAMDHLADGGLVHVAGDSFVARVTVNGHIIVTADREWLTFMAMIGELDDAIALTADPPLDRPGAR